MRKVYLNAQELGLNPDPNMLPGREGHVYRDPSDPAFAIKVLHAPTDRWREKLKEMLANALRSADIAWPTEPVFAADRSTIIGYRMPFAAGKHPIPAVFSSDPTTRWLCADYAFRLRLAINLARAVDTVQRHLCVIGDFSHANTLVGKDATVCLIDPESIQVTAKDGRIYRCEVGTADFTAPELHGLNFADVDRTVFHHAFPLAAMIWELLVGPGYHPFTVHYTGQGTRHSLSERIHLGIWPYSRRCPRDYAPATGAPLHLLHESLHPLMRRCFESGHHNPKHRPLPSEWLAALHNVQSDTHFVQVVAPRREAEAQALRRQVALGHSVTNKPQRAAQPSRRPSPAIPRRSRLRFVLPITAAVLIAAVGATTYFAWDRPAGALPMHEPERPLVRLHTLLTSQASGPDESGIEAAPKNDSPLPTPALYNDLLSENQALLNRSNDTASRIATPPHSLITEQHTR